MNLMQKREAEQRVESVVKKSIDREKFLEEADAAFAALRRDPDAWDEEEQERHMGRNGWRWAGTRMTASRSRLREQRGAMERHTRAGVANLPLLLGS